MSNSLVLLTPADSAACCLPLSAQPLTMDQAEQVAPLLKALADPVRLRLMSLVASHQGGEACVCDLNEAFDLSQPTISHHMKVRTHRAWSARLCLGRRSRDEPASNPSHNDLEACPSILEPEVPAEA
jgi:DNA-binding transcriptional ArsR family regulator